MVKTKRHIKRAKTDTDRYEIAWHPISVGQGEGLTYHKTVWASPTYVGPDSYNSGHIDFIIDNMINDVGAVIRADEGVYLCRRNLSKDKAKFTP